MSQYFKNKQNWLNSFLINVHIEFIENRKSKISKQICKTQITPKLKIL